MANTRRTTGKVRHSRRGVVKKGYSSGRITASKLPPPRDTGATATAATKEKGEKTS